jgi:hypothetical protein
LLKKDKRYIFVIVIVVLTIATSFFAYRYFTTVQKLNALTSGSLTLNKQDIAKLVAKVNKLIILPTDEVPTLATITNVEALAKEQPFYKNAHDGDRLLVYTKAQKAIIFDPNRNVLVNVGPVYVSDSASSTINK